MASCHFCGKEVEFHIKVMRKDTCPHCGRDLHACVQCRFYDPGYHNQCREPKSEMVRDREKANLCGHFQFGAGTGRRQEEKKEDVRKKLDELFKKG